MERDHLEDLSLETRIIIKLIFKTWNGEPRAELMWFRVGTGNGLL
jgi:hypothetical protein